MILLQSIDPGASYLSAASPLGHKSSWGSAVTEPVYFEHRLAEIVSPRRRFTLNQPVVIRLAWEGENWSSESGEFSILAFGTTSFAAIESFCEDFDVMWDMIGKAEPASLSQKATRVKAALVAAVRTVQAK